LFKTQCRFANCFEVGAGIVHQDQAIRIDLGQKVADFFLTQLKQRIAKQQINRP